MYGMKKRCRSVLAWLVCLSLWLAAVSPALAESVSAGLEAPVMEQAPFELSGDVDSTELVERGEPEAAYVPRQEAAEPVSALDGEVLPEGESIPELEGAADTAIPPEAGADIEPETGADIEPEGALVSGSDGGEGGAADASDAGGDDLSADGDEAAQEEPTAEPMTTVEFAAAESDQADDGTSDAAVAAAAQPKGLVLSESSLALGVKETRTLQAKLNGKAAKGVRYKSSNAKVAKIAASGKITAVKTGSAVITATCGSYTAKCKVKVLKAPSKVTLSAGKLTLGVGERESLTAKLPSKTASAITWKSSKKKVARVSGSGEIVAVGKGTATITATTFNGRQAACRVTVKAAPTSIEIEPPELALSVGQTQKVTVRVKGGTGDYALKVSGKAVTLSDNTLKAVKKGTATVTASTYNGLTATCTVAVYSAPKKVTLSGKRLELQPGEESRLVATLPANTLSDLTWTSSNDSVARVDADGLVTAVGVGTANVTVTTFNGRKATCAVVVSDEAPQDIMEPQQIDSLVTLNAGRTMLLALDETRTVAASVEPAEYTSMLKWSASSKVVALKATDGGCVVTGKATGRAVVTAKLSADASATLNVIVVDPTDTSDANLTVVQQALLADERLFEAESGGDVPWRLLEARLVSCGISQERSAMIADKVKNADALYRDLYIFAQGAYNIVGDASRDKHGVPVSMTHFAMDDDTVYLQPSTSVSDETYAYTMIHESGHAIDYNSTGETGLATENDEAAAVLKSDVRTLLMERVGEAVTTAGVDANAVNAEQVVDALLDYRGLTQKETVMAGLNDDEEAVYDSLSDLMASEMNATLPMNNGTMVWDAVEGATNFAVSGNFGHGYMLNMPSYSETAKYYFYDRRGTPRITSEPWAEFFSANIIRDTATIAVNLSYLPQTCKYFAEVFAPQALEYFKGLVSGK